MSQKLSKDIWCKKQAKFCLSILDGILQSNKLTFWRGALCPFVYLQCVEFLPRPLFMAPLVSMIAHRP